MVSTALPILVPRLPGQNFDCQSCGNCCRDLVVHLTPADRRKIDAQQWDKKLDRPPYIRLSGQYALNQTERGCVFLLDNGRCRIHAEHGFHEKPLACQLFPFALSPTRDGFQLMLRFDCPSLAASKGQPLINHQADWKRLADQWPTHHQPDEKIFLKPGRPASALEVNALVGHLERWISRNSLPLMQRIQGLSKISQMLWQVNTRKIHDQRWAELLDILFKALPDDLHDTTNAQTSPPTPRQLKLFRQQVFAHMESARFADAVGGWRTKFPHMLSQFHRSRQYNRLNGMAPPSAITSHTVAFSQIDAVDPAHLENTSIQELIIRYLRSQLLTHSFFGRRYYGWPILMGLQSMAVRLAVWGFLARHYAAARQQLEIDYQAAIQSIGLIVRAAGISRALGSRTEKWRMTYLGLDDGLCKLLRQYPLVARI